MRALAWMLAMAIPLGGGVEPSARRRGDGWCVRDDVLRSSVYEFEVHPAPGWLLMTR